MQSEAASKSCTANNCGKGKNSFENKQIFFRFFDHFYISFLIWVTRVIQRQEISFSPHYKVCVPIVAVSQVFGVDWHLTNVTCSFYLVISFVYIAYNLYLRE